VTLADGRPDGSDGGKHILRGIDRRHEHINRSTLAWGPDSVEHHSLGRYAARECLLRYFLIELFGLPFGQLLERLGGFVLGSSRPAGISGLERAAAKLFFQGQP
jgi:hypothetical protein